MLVFLPALLVYQPSGSVSDGHQAANTVGILLGEGVLLAVKTEIAVNKFVLARPLDGGLGLLHRGYGLSQPSGSRYLGALPS